MSDTPRTDWKEEMYWADPNGHAADVWKWARELEQENAELKAWRESALAVEREWDAQAIATMLGAKPGESCRKVVAREVPKLVAENAALRAELAPLRETVGVRGDATTCREDIYYWSKLVERSDSAIRLEHENAALRRDVYQCPPTSENDYEGFKWSDACEELERENAALRKAKEMVEVERCEVFRTMDLALNESAGLRGALEESQEYGRNHANAVMKLLSVISRIRFAVDSQPHRSQAMRLEDVGDLCDEVLGKKALP